ncbi:claudin-34-like [Rhineura floridana]|uniref:claudin-34-like n=1 Tax=Rhineura floridana TaxID=261503 RepID=UPI002AC84CBA|nr:claudin-34-like [Rhineura floridana]
MPAIVYLGSILAKPPMRVQQGSLVVRWLSLVSCLQLCAFVLSILAWIMCISSTATGNWREWHVENRKEITNGIMFIGIWNVCYGHAPNELEEDSYWHCKEFTEQYPTLPKEIFIAQDLMSLASIVNAVAIGFMSFALYNVFKPVKHKNFIFIFFGLGAALNSSAGILVLIPVSWNMYSVLQGQEIHFPISFQLPKVPRKQHIGASIYMGYIAAGLELLSASLVVIEGCCSKSREVSMLETVVIHSPGAAVKSESQTTCPKCGSTVDLVIQNTSSIDDKPESSKKTYKNSAESPEDPPVHIPKHSVIFVTPCK